MRNPTSLSTTLESRDGFYCERVCRVMGKLDNQEGSVKVTTLMFFSVIFNRVNCECSAAFFHF